MKKIKEIINKFSKTQKIVFLILVLIFILFVSIGIPTLARFKNRVISTTTQVWDGTVATSYKSGTGTESDPYIISNGSELAYFSNQLLINNYENTYFALSNNILLNNGIFDYDVTNGIKYILNEQTYYLGNYSNNYYDNVGRTGTQIGTINNFTPLNGFKGYFNGNSYRVYGLYITNETSDKLALFTNLSGTVKDLYVENTVVYGGTYTAGIASNTENASLSNILFNGYVVGKNNNITKNISFIPSISTIQLQATTKTDYMNISNNMPFVGSEIISTSITGNYTLINATDSNTTIKINGTTVTGGTFNVNLGTTLLNNIEVVTSTTSRKTATLTFSNLQYNISYKYAVSSGIVASSNNTSITNTVNKGYVYGYSSGGGLVGVTTNTLNINKSYNTGNINGQYASGGLVGVVEKSSNPISIIKNYNSGNITATDIGGLVGIISGNTGGVTISDSFNTTTTDYVIGTVLNTTVNVTNTYYTNTNTIKVGSVNGTFTTTSISNLKDKNYVINNLYFNEFISFDDLAVNNNNAWVYDNNSLPILFIDDLNNPIANIHAGVYTWDNLSYSLKSLKFDTNITFSIEGIDTLRPVKEIYYYISNSSIPLTYEEISQINSWNLYGSIVQINEEGYYVIYAKIVDYNDNVSYLNTDILTLGSSSVSINNSKWTDLRSNLNYVYINSAQSVTVNAFDDVVNVEYYITNQVLNENDLNALDSSVWTTYNNSILIDTLGTYVVYIKTVDYLNATNYMNTDYIVYNGYSINNISAGKNPTSYTNYGLDITDKSSINFNISYSSLTADITDYNHNLISTILLPLGTKITLIDNVNKKVYSYTISTTEDIYNFNSSCDVLDTECIKTAIYPFSLFKEISSINKLYSETSYYNNGTISENFTVILDFSNTNVDTNYTNVSVYMELHDSNGTNIRPTLKDSIKYFNIYSQLNGEDTKAILSLNSNYSGQIYYNSNSTANVDINSTLNYKTINNINIIDTTYEDKEIGLAVKLVDSNGNVIGKSHLNIFTFKIDDITYYPNNDNIVHINLKNGINDTSKILNITTIENNDDLSNGTYYLKISNYASYDGIYYDELGSNELTIPVIVENESYNNSYNFDVIADSSNNMVSKNNSNVKVTFNILQSGSFINPNIRVSMYEKSQITAYNQDYSIVDLKNYVSDTLSVASTNVYYVSTNPTKYDGTINTYNYFELNLITSNFNNNGYKFLFELYDDNNKIGTIEKYFVVR